MPSFGLSVALLVGGIVLGGITQAGVAISVASADAGPAPVGSILERRQKGVVLQRWDLSCAAAALATILRYQHGEPVSERLVALGLIARDAYIANPDLVRLRQGFSFLDMKRFVDGRGYRGVGLGELSLGDLLERAPIIVPINLRGYPHFVVFRGATANTVLLADPAFGNVTMSIDKFIAGWIDYAEIGHVGFVVALPGGLAPPRRLSADAMDVVMLRHDGAHSRR